MNEQYIVSYTKDSSLKWFAFGNLTTACEYAESQAKVGATSISVCKVIGGLKVTPAKYEVVIHE